MMVNNSETYYDNQHRVHLENELLGLTGIKGSYILVLELSELKQIQIGKLGYFNFPKGYYAYVGSAFGPGGLPARLKHHLKKARRPHWHIDYLGKEAKIKEIWIADQGIQMEHALAEYLMAMENASVPVLGFGSSDCNCLTHLVFFDNRWGQHRIRDNAGLCDLIHLILA